MLTGSDASGYSALSIVAHWIGAILVIALFFTHEAERGSLGFSFHVAGGAVAGIFLLWRVWHRVRRGFAAEPDQAYLFNLVVRVVLWGFLVSIAVVVITGYLLPWTLARPIEFPLGLSIPSPLPKSAGLHEFMEELHDISGHLFVPLLLLHLLGAAKHAFIDKDGTVRRMFSPTSAGR